MRIALVGPVYPYRGGISHYTMQLAQALAEQNCLAQVVSYQRQYPAWLYPGVTDKDPSLSPLRVDAEFILDPLYPWTWLRAVGNLTRQKPDLVVLQWWTTIWGPALIALASLLKRKKIPVVYLIHNVLPHEQRFFDRWLAKAALSRGVTHITQTPRERERLLALLPQADVRLVTLPVYSRMVGSRIPQKEARLMLNLPGGRAVFLFFGIVRPYKGLKVLLEALTSLTPEERPTLIIAGEIWEDQTFYQDYIQTHGLTESVRIDNRYIPDEEIPALFSAADALIAPYIGGTQSAVVGMALAFGLPMIVSDLVAAGIAPEHRNNVHSIPSGDTSALADAIRTFTAEEGLGKTCFPAADNWADLVQMLKSIAAEQESKRD
jgi:glycosyltransferase involved in cell wall biosynthesis